jgi:hypothetical protein
MANRNEVIRHTDKALKAKTHEEKLDELARAINELARFIGNVEDKLTIAIYAN